MSRLLSLFRSLDRYEVARLRKFVCSPFFNENAQLVVLFDELKTHYWRSEQTDIDKNVLWQKINPSEKYNDLKYRRLISDLLQIVEAFLVQQARDAEDRHDLMLLQQLSKRNLNKHFDNTEQQFRQQLEAAKLQDFDYYAKKFVLEEIVFQHRNES